MPAITIREVQRKNIRTRRARLGLTQADVAKRMNQLGYAWYTQTAGLIERDQRPLLADELVALALCLETTPGALYLPPADTQAVQFGDHVIPAGRIARDPVSWWGSELRVDRRKHGRGSR
jgi:transcriptional regulator with XRE-family HTH domain